MKYCSFLRIAALAFAGLMSSSAFAAVLMPSGGDDTSAIQNALNSAGTGTVELGEGTFIISGTAGITWSNGATLKGQGWDKTIVQGGSCQRGFKLSGGSKIEGMTIQGFTGSYRGSAIYVEKGSVSWCCVKDNISTATDTGNGSAAGICILNGTIDHCIIANNDVASSSCAIGAGIGGLQGGSDGSKIGPVTIDTCLIYGNDNEGTKVGGGIAFSNWSGAVTIRNCTIVGNSAKGGSGGVYHDATAGKVTLINNIITGNTVGESELNVSVKANFLDMTDSAATIITGSATGTGPYVDASIVSELSAKGFASADPKFADAYHIGNGSPAVAAGTAVASGAVDLDKVAFAAPPSIGCYECDSMTAVPKFSPEDGRTFVSTLDVTLSCKTEGATIRYTTNGSEPTTSTGTVYSGPIRLTATTTIKAVAYANGLDASAVASATYTKAAATAPTLDGGKVTISPRTTGAVFEGKIASVGNNGATKCDVYLVYVTSGGSLGTPVKIASGLAVGNTFKYTVSGLTPSTAYDYEVTVTNDAEPAMSAKLDGSFTTKTAGAIVNPGSTPEETWEILQSEIDAAPDGTVQLAEATFEIKKELTINNGASLVGNAARPDKVVIALVTQNLSDGDHSMLVISGSPNTTVSGITFSGAGAHGGDNNFGPKSGVQMDSGTLEDCVIRNVETRNNSYDGAGVNMTGGTLRRCTVTGCSAIDSGGACKAGEGIYMTGGLVENCIISNNGNKGGGKVDSQGGAVCILGGILRGCLVYGNKNRVTASGVGVAGGAKADSPAVVVENCTIVGNSQNASDSNAYGLCVYYNNAWAKTKCYNVVIRNNIVWGNYAFDGTTEVNCNFEGAEPSALTTVYNDTKPKIDGEGNVSSDPKFENAAARDYHIGASVCYDGGLNQSWMEGAFDLDGNPRIRHDVVDIGCYERAPATDFACTILMDSDGALGHAKVSFAFTCENGTPNSAIWTLSRAQDGVSKSFTDFVFTNLVETGNWSVSLSVTDKNGLTATAEDLLEVKAKWVYVSEDGSAQFPYDSVETGARNIETGFPLLGDGGTLVLCDGHYVIEKSISLNGSGATRIESVNGPKKTVIRLADNENFKSTQDNGLGFYGLTLTSSDAYVSGVTFIAGRPSADYDGPQYTTTGFVKLSAEGAVVTNCVFRDLNCTRTGAGDGNGKGVALSKGTITDCTFTRINSYSAGGATLQGGVIRIEGGLADRLVVQDCADVNTCAPGGRGDIVAVYGSGVLRNSLITGCTSLADSPVYVGVAAGGNPEVTISGQIESCTIVGNHNLQTSAGDYRQSVVAVYGGRLLNSIVVDNRSSFSGSVSNLWIGGKSEVTYTLVNDRDPSFATPMNHNVVISESGADVFRRPDDGDYRLKAKSPAIDAGQEFAWMVNALDLAGKPRSVGKAPDIGCYEYASAVPFGITVFVQ